MYYLGIDVSKKTIDCCLTTDSIFYERRFDNTEDGFKRLDDWIQDERISSLYSSTKSQGKATEVDNSRYHAQIGRHCLSTV